MKVGLIGYPQVGKTTLFHAASRGPSSSDISAVSVPDDRFDILARLSESKKLSPAHVDFHDNVGNLGATKGVGKGFFEAARKMDVLLHVVRAFDNPIAPAHDTINPLRDHQGIEEELIIEDQSLVETRLDRLQKNQATHQSGSPESNEFRLLKEIHTHLEDGQAIRTMGLGVEEWRVLSSFQFLSGLPMICAVNVGEGQAAESVDATAPELAAFCQERGIPCVSLCASIEEEIATLEDADQVEFLADLGLKEPAAYRVIRAAYDALGLITFFTTGPKETHAWPIRKGCTALEAAGAIHSDLARGFIRAEIGRYQDCVDAGGWDPAHSNGKTTLQGKEYIMQDGDVLVVRFKV